MTPARVARNLLAVAVSLAVAALAGWILDVRPKEALAAVSRMAPWALAACLASAFVVLALQALRWWAVMRPLLGLRYRDIYRALIVGAMFNAILPYRAGDLLRVQYLGRRTGVSRATILGTQIVDRWIDLWGCIPALALVCALGSPPPWLVRALGVFCVAVVLLGAAMALVTRRRGLREGSRLRAGWTSFQGGIAAFRAPRTWLAFLVAPLPWLWEGLVLTLISPGLGFHLSFAAAFNLLVGFNLAMVVPSPGAVGAVEAGGAAVLVLLGADRSVALAWMLVYHLTQLLPGIAGGALVLVQGARPPGAQGGDKVIDALAR